MIFWKVTVSSQSTMKDLTTFCKTQRDRIFHQNGQVLDEKTGNKIHESQYIISKQGISPDPEKAKAIVSAPVPDTAQKRKYFLCTISFCVISSCQITPLWSNFCYSWLRKTRSGSGMKNINLLTTLFSSSSQKQQNQHFPAWQKNEGLKYGSTLTTLNNRLWC